MNHIQSVSQHVLASIFDGIQDAIIAHDHDYIIVSWNPAAETILGYTAAEAIGNSMLFLIPERLREEQQAIYEQVKAGRRVAHLQTIYIAAGRQELPVSLTVSPVKDDQGHITGASYILRDITQDQIAEQRQAMLAAIVQGSQDAVISKTLEGIIMTWNPGAERLFGYTESEVTGKHISILIPVLRLEEEATILNTIRAGGQIEHFQTTRLHKSGREFHISLTISPIRDRNGQIIGASKIARDITEQKHAEQQIVQNARNLEILNSIGKAISEQMDVQTILQKVTDATTKITGAAFGAFFYNMVDEKGESFMLFSLSGAPREAFERLGMPRNTAVFDPTFSGEGVVRSDDITQDPRYGHNSPHAGMPEGHLPVVSYLAVPVKSVTGYVIGGLFFGHPEKGVFKKEHEDLVVNIASQAAVALDNSKLFEEIKALSLKKDEFIAMATHELKTPLTTLSGYLQILQKSQQKGPGALFMDKALSQLRKLNALVTDLFDVSKIQAGKLQMLFEPFDLSHFIRDIVDTFRTAHPLNDIRFEESGHIDIEADKLRLEQVMSNLLTNAIKYSEGNPVIEVKTEVAPDTVTVSVKDEGMGIDTENLKHIFSQFYRVEGNSRTISGMGLGLFITKEIVERHHGYMHVESEPGKGSVFSFTLPRHQSPS